MIMLMGFLAITSCGKKETATTDEQTEASESTGEGETPVVSNILIIEGWCNQSEFRSFCKMI